MPKLQRDNLRGPDDHRLQPALLHRELPLRQVRGLPPHLAARPSARPCRVLPIRLRTWAFSPPHGSHSQEGVLPGRPRTAPCAPWAAYRGGGGGRDIRVQAKDAGFDVTAIEQDATSCRTIEHVVGARAICSNEPACAISEEAPARAIALWQSLEHLVDPWSLLDAAADNLQGGGVLVIATPNPEAFSLKILGALAPPRCSAAPVVVPPYSAHTAPSPSWPVPVRGGFR